MIGKENMKTNFCSFSLALAFLLWSSVLTATPVPLALEAVAVRQHLTLYPVRGQFSARFEIPGRDVSEMQLSLFVPGSIDPSSVMLRSALDPFSIGEVRYQDDLLDNQTWQNALVGKTVEYQVEGDHPLGPLLSGRLVSFNPTLLEVGSKLVMAPPGTLVFEKQHFVGSPTLYWQVQGDFRKPVSIDVSYMATGIQWSASHDLVVATDEVTTELMTWADIVNSTKRVYPLDSLSLVAGEINTVDLPRPKMNLRSTMAESGGYMMASDSSPQRQSLGIYHEYQYNKPVEIQSKGVQRLPLISDYVLQSKLVYQLKSEVSLYNNVRQQPRQAVNTLLRLQHQTRRSGDGLSLPIPSGLARIYLRDNKGGIRFLGEDWLASMPEGVPGELKVGRAFDVTVERAQTDYRRVSDRVVILENTLDFHNASKNSVVIEVQEQLPGDWELLEESMPSEPAQDLFLNYRVSVKPGKRQKLVYKVRARR